MPRFLLGVNHNYQVTADTFQDAVTALNNYLSQPQPLYGALDTPGNVDPLGQPVPSLVGAGPEWKIVYTNSGDIIVATIAPQGPPAPYVPQGFLDKIFLNSYDRIFKCYKTGLAANGENSYLLLLSVQDETNGGLFQGTPWQIDTNLPAGRIDKNNGTMNPDTVWTELTMIPAA